MHWPVSGLRNDTWKALIKLQELGKTKAIGVSNFMIRHLDELLAKTDIIPAVIRLNSARLFSANRLRNIAHEGNCCRIL